MIRCLVFKNSQIFKKGKNQIKKEFLNFLKKHSMMARYLPKKMKINWKIFWITHKRKGTLEDGGLFVHEKPI